MEYGDGGILETDNEWTNSSFVNFEFLLVKGAVPNGVVSLAVWLPDVPDGQTVPVIAEFGPYFDDKCGNSIDRGP